MRLTIGIPSYNEQLSIANLLKALETQVIDEHQISEIIISDDSADNTSDIVNDIARNSKMNITLIHHNKRRGAASAWNEIFANANGEIIVLYDADVIPETKTTSLLASSINNEVALCAANPLPVRQKGIAARATAFNSSWLRRVRKSGLSQYTVMGRALSIRKDVARQITIPDVIAIDLYLQCKVLEQGYRIHYSDDAVVWFKPPTTLLDFTSQVARAVRGHEEISDYIKKFNISLPSSALLKEAIKAALSDPAGMFAVAVSYAIFPLYKMKISNGKEQAIWHVADSTKGITVDDLHDREPRK
jgi:cellulose synthase/poly-beta-1,6-N-acetylglucosamine synthase-like glycosyltransferase